MRIRWKFEGLLASGWLAILGVAAPVAEAGECEKVFDSTFALIQEAIFENRGCTAQACHGSAIAGGLDLREGASYDSLVRQPAQSVAGWQRVIPGQKDESLLWHNLAAATLPEQWHAPLRAMPIGLAPLSLDELEALREWIESGAPRNGVLPVTGELLDACLPPAEPIAVDPLDPPAFGKGVQLRMPRWEVPVQGEDEVCFASYYNLEDQVPAQYRGPNGDTFRYKSIQILQDPLSHHLIVSRYTGQSSPNASAWGPFTCKGGDRHGESCQPTDMAFCRDGLCGSRPRSIFACIGFGPSDSGFGIAAGGFTGTQETGSISVSAQGVYEELPLEGMIIWNSHAFNLTDFPGKVEAWLNFEFAAPNEQIFPELDIFNFNAINAMTVPPYETDEVCNIHTLPANAQLTTLSSHVHKRGKRFRTFLGAFRCAGTGRACTPFGPDLDMQTPDLCAGAPCESVLPPEIGDCDGDLRVEVPELVLGVNMALGNAARSACRRFDPDVDFAVSITDLIAAVRAALNPQLRDPVESLLYTNFVYNDPVEVRFDPPLSFTKPEATADERSLTYCSLYDNGFTDPSEVKRKSTAPPGSQGSCFQPRICAAGKVGAACSGSSQAQRDASCDSSPGTGDGHCDACTVVGGDTTDDEMFILLGTYYIQ
jgi:hypothetical protein